MVNVGTKEKPVWRYVHHNMRNYEQEWMYKK